MIFKIDNNKSQQLQVKFWKKQQQQTIVYLYWFVWVTERIDDDDGGTGGGGGGGGGRAGLLSSIEGFSKGGLKKAVTVDKSG